MTLCVSVRAHAPVHVGLRFCVHVCVCVCVWVFAGSRVCVCLWVYVCLRERMCVNVSCAGLHGLVGLVCLRGCVCVCVCACVRTCPLCHVSIVCVYGSMYAGCVRGHGNVWPP